jgi:transcriptional regulator
MTAANRRRGTANPHNKLTESDIRLIRRMLALGYTQSIIAQKLGTSQAQISRIAAGQQWNWLKN